MTEEYEIMLHFIEPSDYTDYSETFCKKKFSANSDEEAILFGEKWLEEHIDLTKRRGTSSICVQKKKSGKMVKKLFPDEGESGGYEW